MVDRSAFEEDSPVDDDPRNAAILQESKEDQEQDAAELLNDEFVFKQSVGVHLDKPIVTLSITSQVIEASSTSGLSVLLDLDNSTGSYSQ